jgi:hypothetical protein
VKAPDCQLSGGSVRYKGDMRIFVSSTFKDLRAERQAAEDVLRRAQLVPWGMELFVSEPSTPLEVALHELQLSDAVVLIIGFKAGSLVEERPDVTYTGAEFRRAQELGKPLFVFFQTEGGTWRNKETTAALKTALEDFKRAVLDSKVTPAYFDSPDRLQVELLLALEKWNAEGRPGARLTFTTAEEFFAPYRSVALRLFDFNQTLSGRDAEMQTLNAFLADQASLVGILTGRGGIGKSKLLHDWVSTLKDVRVLYVREDADWHAEAAKEIPVGNVVIVADDAHRFDFLDKLLILVLNLKQRQNIKLVLSTLEDFSSIARILGFSQRITSGFLPGRHSQPPTSRSGSEHTIPIDSTREVTIRSPSKLISIRKPT